MPPHTVPDQALAATLRHPPPFPRLGDACGGLSDQGTVFVQVKKASAASGELRLTVEERVGSQRHRQMPARDTEQASSMKQTRADLASTIRTRACRSPRAP